MFLSFHLPFVLLFLYMRFNIVFMIIQLDGLLSHWQPAFANKLID